MLKLPALINILITHNKLLLDFIVGSFDITSFNFMIKRNNGNDND
jgi:hypothetical protein